MDYINRATELTSGQNYEYIEKTILLALKEEKVSLSQAIGVFESIIRRIERENLVNL